MIAACMGQVSHLDSKDQLHTRRCPCVAACYRHEVAQKAIHQHNPQQPWVVPQHVAGGCSNQLRRVYALVGEAA